ncbi:protein SSUH2 homolog isoform 2-T2 [Pholidichthys leucotaenia]
MTSAVYPPNNLPGYEGIGAGGGGYLPPPMPLEPVAPPQPGTTPEEWSIPSLSEDVARDAFKSFASSHCCYSKAPATDGVITNMEPFNTFRYRLETFTESRSTEWASKPHEGEPVDFYTQPAPRPWEVQATPPNFFTDHKEEIRVPYTSSIQDCNMCRASGALPCDECHGSGDKDCRACNGAGMSDTGNCHHCNGTGKEKCKVCNGRRTKKCPTCKGKRQLLTFIKVKVEWVNHVEDHVVEQNSGLKIKDLRLVSGKELIKNNQYLRQRVELIPITKVNYKWKGDTHVYYVYGKENQVSADNYPATCCCVVQ